MKVYVKVKDENKTREYSLDPPEYTNVDEFNLAYYELLADVRAEANKERKKVERLLFVVE